MRKISTRTGVYVILLIAAIYGSFSVMNEQGKTAMDTAVIIQKATASAKAKELTAGQSFYLFKNNNPQAGHLVTLQSNTVLPATAATEPGFFTHSATIHII